MLLLDNLWASNCALVLPTHAILGAAHVTNQPLYSLTTPARKVKGRTENLLPTRMKNGLVYLKQHYPILYGHLNSISGLGQLQQRRSSCFLNLWRFHFTSRLAFTLPLASITFHHLINRSESRLKAL